MATIPRASFGDLSIELVDIILGYVARPTFAQPDQYRAKNPYSTAHKLCLVSQHVRRHVALPEMLHTVLLDSHNKVAFVHALRMQKEYAQTDSRLCFAYTRYINNIWIGEFCLGGEYFYMYRGSNGMFVPDSDLDLLAPVLLGAPSLAIDFGWMHFLTRCVEHAWTHMGEDIDQRCLLPPWRTKTLALSGLVTDPWPMTMFASGQAFLASLAHLVVLPNTIRDLSSHVVGRALGIVGPQDYILPHWMINAPWALLKRLESISLAFPRVELPFYATEYSAGMNLQTELLTLPASLVKGHCVPLEVKASTETGDRFISLDDVHVVVSNTRVHFCVYCQEWEKVWACGW
ncbi:uncharacterized protein EDB93DRAFT_1130985 [Suillus bovinus]|uniref:uncharacterized protein n=1 Tax=Suillus bovinus TaxID=48563 RepID=UPI001B85CBB0|nr:uncharacterized protein EDB93DRAFT_1130985 [Suillus bovinus]KAG2155055.1 hypothetical protein EDB93DRAFT_1130985 [Suillus bovinus]